MLYNTLILIAHFDFFYRIQSDLLPFLRIYLVLLELFSQPGNNTGLSNMYKH